MLCKTDSGAGLCRGYDASEERGVEEESGEKAGGSDNYLCNQR